MHVNNLHETFKKIYEAQNQPELQYLVQVLQMQLKLSNDFIKKAMD